MVMGSLQRRIGLSMDQRLSSYADDLPLRVICTRVDSRPPVSTTNRCILGIPHRTSYISTTPHSIALDRSQSHRRSLAQVSCLLREKATPTDSSDRIIPFIMSRFNLQEELNSLSADPSLYPIPSELDPSSLSERELDGHLTSAITSIINDPDSLTHSTGLTFDVFCSILKHADAPQVGPGVLGKTLDVITTGLTNQVNAVVALARAENDDDPDGPAAHRTPLEMWAFLLQWFVNIGEKAGKGSDDVPRATKGKGKKKATPAGNAPTFDWELVLPSVLATMHRALRLPTARIWRTSSEKEAFIGCFVKPCYQLCEVESHLKNTEIKLGVFKTICLSVKFHGHGFGAQTSIIQNLTYFEHLSEPMAELLAILEKEFDHPQLADEVLRDVSAKTFAPGDQKGPRSFSKFLVKLAELSPRVVQKQMSLLLAHLDSDVSFPRKMSLTPGAPDADGFGRDHRHSHSRYCGINRGGRRGAEEQAD